ncbi:hypothetical protein M9R32_08925 [Paenisporosarcina quisquiliarum]|uniref:Uncharacterized protein n=1 Tax=Paenisporosarcina quisquiliarum TaxID=365346 RepID=A0A9X3RD80_9BACL|nr:hypothetical protein [Paenisporosarcina quisquiliarum]MCZ8537301.1 hypothetical protein [Paenisporosarcina quisquiliarum]
MNNWKLATIILAILLGISLMWSVQQRANSEKTQLKAYALEHAQLEYALKDAIESYEQGGSQKELGERLHWLSGFVVNINPAGETVAFHSFDFDYDTNLVLYEVHRKARGNQATEEDIDRLKILHQLINKFQKTALDNVERKTVDDYETEFIEFMEYYETQKEKLIK